MSKYQLNNTEQRPNTTTATTTRNVFTSSSSMDVSIEPKRRIENGQKLALSSEEVRVRIKRKNESATPILETSEFRLLCRLFLPKRKIIISEKATLIELLPHLPELVDEQRLLLDLDSNINFQLHFFLASIIVQYVNTWYFSKLSTNNYDFISYLYSTLCTLSGTLISRMRAHSVLSWLEILDDLCNILEKHINGLKNELNDEYARISTFFSNSELNSREAVHINQTLFNYLLKNHIVFETGQSSISSETFEVIELRKLAYLRFISKRIIIEALRNDSNIYSSFATIDGDLSIAGDFLVIMLGDIVLHKAVSTLSSPLFLFSKIESVLGTMESEKDKAREEQSTIMRHFLQLILYCEYICYLIMMPFKFLSFIYRTSKLRYGSESRKEAFSIFDCSLFPLLDSLTDFSISKPLVTAILRVMVVLLRKVPLICNFTEDVAKTYIERSILQCGFGDTEFYSKAVSELRSLIFIEVEVQDTSSVPDKDKDVKMLASRIAKFIRRYSYTGYTDADLTYDTALFNRILTLLMIFNTGKDGQLLQSFNETSLLNELLALKFLECVLAHVFSDI